MIGFSSEQFVLILTAYTLFGAMLGIVPGVLMATFLRQARRTALLDAAIGICGVLVGLWASGWASLRVSYMNGHGVGPRGFWAEYGLLLGVCLAVGMVVARHTRLRQGATSSR